MQRLSRSSTAFIEFHSSDEVVFGEPRSDEAYPGDRVVLLANFWHPNFGALKKCEAKPGPFRTDWELMDPLTSHPRIPRFSGGASL